MPHIEQDLLCWGAFQTEAAESLLSEGHAKAEKDVLPIMLCHSEQGCVYNHKSRAITWSPPELLNKAQTTIRLSQLEEKKRDYEKVVGQKLGNMGIGFTDAKNKLEIIDDLFEHAEVAVPGVPLVMVIVDITLKLSGFPADDADSEDRAVNQTHESFFTHLSHSFADYKSYFMGKLIPPFEGLEQLRRDSLEEATIRQNPSCPICFEDFAQGADELIARLPCAHYFHPDCILKCLRIRQTCPLCRYPMPQAQETYSYI